MAVLMAEGRQSFEDSAGRPLVGGKLFTYDAGTNSPRTTYADADATVPNTNPIVLDARGECVVFWSGAYKVVLTDADDVVIWTQDNIISTDSSGEAAILRADLANFTNPTKGASLVGYTRGLPYGADSVGDALNDLWDANDAQALSIAELRLVDVDAMGSFVTDIAAGTVAAAACFGDSTMWGADPSNLAVQVAIPPPAQLQNLVRSYFANTALTVTNNALSGTTCTQMIAGTDGSGSTFETKMAASTARVVYCNHGVNDAFGPNATTPAAYKTALLAFVTTVRKYGKTPVLVTPFPSLTIGTFGSQARAQATGYFAQIMRDVAEKHGVLLVDNNRYLRQLLGIDGYLPLAVLPDGVHGAQSTYSRTGNNLAEAILGGQVSTFTVPDQRIPVTSPSVLASGQTISADASSRVGAVVTTGTVATQSLRFAFKVDEPGMDVYFAHPIFSNGCANIAISVDGLVSYNMSQLIAGFAATFWHDVETLIARSMEPGFHVLLISTSSAGAIGSHYLRTRAAAKPKFHPSANAVPAQRTLIAAKLENEGTVAGTQFVTDSAPVSRLIDGYEIEWTGQMQTTSGVIVGGNTGTNAGSTACEKGVIFGLDNVGRLAVYEATAPSTYTSSVYGAVDLSLASHLYRVAVTTAGVASLYVDGVLIGTHNLVQPYYGGLLGLWKNNAAGVLSITNLCRVWRI